MRHRLIYRYLLRQLAETFVLSLIVLALILSLGVVIKPLSQGLIDVRILLRIFCYATPNMLVVAMPFAATFTGAIILFKLRTNNEILSMQASGISFGQLLRPVYVLGVLIMLICLVLLQQVLPQFWRLIHQEIQLDVAHALIKQVKNNRLIKIHDYIIYADQGQTLTPTMQEREEFSKRNPETTGRELVCRLVMQDVVIRQELFDAESRSKFLGNSYYISDYATIDLSRDDDKQLYISTALKNVVYHSPQKGLLVTVQAQPIAPQLVTNRFRERRRFQTFFELTNQLRHPEKTSQLVLLQKQFVSAFEEQYFNQWIRNNLRERHSIVWLDAQGDTQTLNWNPRAKTKIQTLGNRHWRLSLSSSELFTLKNTSQTFTTSSLDLSVTQGHQNKVNIKLNEPFLVDKGIKLEQWLTSQLEFYAPKYTPKDFKDWEPAHLLEQARLKRHSFWDHKRKHYYKKEGQVIRSIISQIHERFAYALHILLSILLGVLFGLTSRRSTPLQVFWSSFLWILVSYLIISAGGNVARKELVTGLSVMWSGNGLLILMIMILHRRLYRTV